MKLPINREWDWFETVWYFTPWTIAMLGVFFITGSVLLMTAVLFIAIARVGLKYNQ